jgi:CheY-like chemotaxis protein
VLVVEDNLVNQKVVRLLLARRGCRVDVAANGAEALAILDRLAYDLVLMDCQMPEVDGYEATRSLRRGAGPNARTTVVAMTANVLPGDRERCIDAGMDDYVAKPIREDELERVLASARAGAARAARGMLVSDGGDELAP